MLASHPAVRLGNETNVPMEARVRNESDILGLKPNHLKHHLELIIDLVETLFGPAARVHFVDTHNNLVNTKHQERREGVRAGGSVPL